MVDVKSRVYSLLMLSVLGIGCVCRSAANAKGHQFVIRVGEPIYKFLPSLATCQILTNRPVFPHHRTPSSQVGWRLTRQVQEISRQPTVSFWTAAHTASQDCGTHSEESTIMPCSGYNDIYLSSLYCYSVICGICMCRYIDVQNKVEFFKFYVFSFFPASFYSLYSLVFYFAENFMQFLLLKQYCSVKKNMFIFDIL